MKSQRHHLIKQLRRPALGGVAISKATVLGTEETPREVRTRSLLAPSQAAVHFFQKQAFGVDCQRPLSTQVGIQLMADTRSLQPSRSALPTAVRGPSFS